MEVRTVKVRVLFLLELFPSCHLFPIMSFAAFLWYVSLRSTHSSLVTRHSLTHPTPDRFHGLIVQHHCGAGVGFKANFFVKFLLMGGHQVNPLDTAEVGMADHSLHQFSSESGSLIVGVNDYIPNGGAVNAV